MKKYFLLFFFASFSNVYAGVCGNQEVILKDKDGNTAIIKETYDCWEKDGRANKCSKLSDISKSQNYLTGFRSHHVVYKGKEYAFVESWRRGSPAYVTGAFQWDSSDVKTFIKVPFGFADGSDDKTIFTFNSKLDSTFQSLSAPPKEIDGKTFKFSGCK